MIEIRRQSQSQNAPTRAQSPITGDTAPRAINNTADAQGALRRNLKPFLDTTGQRNYSLFSRIAFDFLRRNYPPTVDSLYWQQHPSLDAEMPPTEEAYWGRVSADMVQCMRQAGTEDDRYLVQLLWCQADELQREAKRLKLEAVEAGEAADDGLRQAE